jgi:hypoxanthine-DNA glycosylase
MSEIIRNRTIRTSTRLEKSKSYKIDTKTVSRGDTLVVNIDHETKPFLRTFKFNGADVAFKDSISFRVNDFGTSIDISWSGAEPIGTTSNKITTSKLVTKQGLEVVVTETNSTNIKKSFDPISDSETIILILGTMPGDKSLELQEYYGNARNRFWKIISTITNNELPFNYSDKKKLLLKTKIGVWDVAHKADRKGSLDSAIKNEEPNDLKNFITKHKNLKVIGFNGTKSKALFDKYFDREKQIKYILLPSTSQANTGIDFENICKAWQQILTT